MMDVDAASFPPRLDPTRVAEASAFSGRPAIPLGRDGLDQSATIRDHHGSTRHLRLDTSATKTHSSITRTNWPSRPAGGESPAQAAGYSASPRDNLSTEAKTETGYRASTMPSSSSNSQETNSSNAQDRVFTPSPSERAGGQENGLGRESSQESQLLQLSQIAAARSKQLDGAMEDHADGGMSRKRTADGAVKLTRSGSNASPAEYTGYAPSHSRTTSSVSMASTCSRLTEISVELKTRLIYADVKLRHGWQSQNIDQIEPFASHVGSPASSTSTIHYRNGSSASPSLPEYSRRDSAASTRGLPYSFQPRNGADTARSGGMNGFGSHMSPPLSTLGVSGSTTTTSALAPPALIEPSRPNARRNSNPLHTPSFLTNTPGQPHSYNASPSTAARTPAQAYGHPLHTSRANGFQEPLFSPSQDARDQDAIDALIFMKSPANSNNMRHAFPQSPSQPLPTGHERPGANTGTSQRRALPSGRPGWSASPRSSGGGPGQSYSQPQPRRVDFEASPTDANGMEMDEQLGTPRSRGTPRCKTNGGSQGGASYGQDGHIASRLKATAGLSAPDRPRRKLADADIDRMLDGAERDESSDSEGEIELPPQRPMGRAVGS